MMLADFLAVAGGLAVLALSADRFINAAATTARLLGVPPLLVGLTVVGFGTSAPEMVVSVIASIQGREGIAIGNVIGSNVANMTLVLGSAAVITPLVVQPMLVRREMPLVIGISVLTVGLALDNQLSAIDGIILLIGLAGFLGFLVMLGRRGESDPLAPDLASDPAESMSPRAAVLWLLLGLALLPASSQALVWGAGNIAAAIGVSELVIGLTVVAVGTSLPELATAISAVRQKQPDLVIGNVLGSNLFNILAVLPFPALLAPGFIPAGALVRDMPAMLAAILAVYLLSRFGANRIGRGGGLLLLAGFVGYGVLLFMQRFQ